MVYNKTENKYIEIKYLDQHELAEGWDQIIPKYNSDKIINHFSITLCFLPDKLWNKLKKPSNDINYKTIKDGITRYTIIETNQDNIMILLYKEIKKFNYSSELINYYINNLNASQYSSWLVIKAKKLLEKRII